MSDHECTIIQPLLGAYLDGEIPHETAESLAGHLETCPACRRVLEQVAETDRLLQGMHADHPTELQWARVEQRLMAHVRTRTWLETARTAAYAAAAVLLVAVALWLVSLVGKGHETAVPAGSTITAQGEQPEETPIEISIERG
jgi:predicted anti-sigma-YlaC factor YlaD